MDPNAVSIDAHAPEITRTLGDFHTTKIEPELDTKLHHLVLLRASQINKCSFCIDMHIREAKADGETDQRLNRVMVWDEVDDFSGPERVALAWTEALTTLDPHLDFQALRRDLSEHFSEREVALLTSAISMINLWNRLAISYHRPK